MAEQLVDEFISRLERIESGGDAAEMASLFAEECELGNVALARALRGTDGARQFWTNYQASIGKVRSVFKNRIESADRAALEWTTEGRMASCTT